MLFPRSSTTINMEEIMKAQIIGEILQRVPLEEES